MTWQATPHLGALHVVCALRNPSRGRSSAIGWKWTNWRMRDPTNARAPSGHSEVINMKDHFVPQQRARLFLRNFKKREEFPLLEDILAGCAGGRWGNSSPGCEDNYGIEYRGCEETEAE